MARAGIRAHRVGIWADADAPRGHHAAGRAGAPRLVTRDTNDGDVRDERRPSMKVREIMTRPALTVGPEMPVLEAQHLMASHRIRHLPVTDGGRLMGIVTDRDIRLNLPSPATSLSVWEVNYLLARLTVGSVMRHAVITVDPDRDAAQAAQIMLDHKIGALPVVDGGAIVGIVTETDMLRAFATMATGTMLVGR